MYFCLSCSCQPWQKLFFAYAKPSKLCFLHIKDNLWVLVSTLEYLWVLESNLAQPSKMGFLHLQECLLLWAPFSCRQFEHLRGAPFWQMVDNAWCTIIISGSTITTIIIIFRFVVVVVDINIAVYLSTKFALTTGQVAPNKTWGNTWWLNVGAPISISTSPSSSLSSSSSSSWSVCTALTNGR